VSLTPKLIVILLVLVGVPFALGGILMLLSGRRYKFASGRVWGVMGELGGGKSMFVVAKVLHPAARALRSRRGLYCSHSGRRVHRIITNFTYRSPWPGVEVIQLTPQPDVTIWQQLLWLAQPDPDHPGELRLDAVVCIDEMSMFAPADERHFDPVARALLIHMRKLNGEFHYVCQDVMQVHKRCRTLSQRIWKLRELDTTLSALTFARWFRATGHRVDGNGMPAEEVDRRAVRMTKRVVRSYESFEVIASDVEELTLLSRPPLSVDLEVLGETLSEVGSSVDT
jgi:hypothetical protein